MIIAGKVTSVYGTLFAAENIYKNVLDLRYMRKFNHIITRVKSLILQNQIYKLFLNRTTRQETF